MLDRVCISLGEKCNLRCRYCHFESRKSGNKQEFSLKELIQIIDNINNHACSNDIPIFKIGIVGSGEPLSEFKLIKQVINYVVENKLNRLKFYTITNGTTLTEKRIQFFKTHKDIISLNISLDGYEEIHNAGRERYKDVMNGIYAYEMTFGVKPAINCTVHRKTLENADKLLTFFEKENFQNITFSMLVDSNDHDLVISKNEYDSFLLKCKGYSFSVRQLKEENSKKYDCTMYGKLCGVGKTNVFITKRGIYPCGRFYGNDEYSYGKFNDPLTTVESKFSTMKSLLDGECYYEKYVLGGNQ